MKAPEITVTVTRSAGDDRAVVVFIDTNGLEPNASDGGPGLRVLINDDDTYVGKPYEHNPDVTHEAGSKVLPVALHDIPYLED